VKSVKAVIRPDLYEKVAEALAGIGVVGLTATECMGHGRQKGHPEIYRGVEYEVKYVPKIHLDIVVDDDRVSDVIELLELHARSGKVGDGKIFINPLHDAIRIRDGQRGVEIL